MMILESKVLLALLSVSVAVCGVLLYMCRSADRENAELRAALAKTSAMLAETQAELQLRETVIAKRDAEVAELERKAEQQETKYARLVRTKKAVQDWDAVALPDDVLGMLRAGDADRPADSARNTDNGGGNP